MGDNTNKRNLIISVHDATPKYKGELTEIIRELDRLEVNKRSILVIPNLEEKYDLRKDYAFVSRLRELKNEGDEIILHGYNHESTQRKGYYKNPFQWFMGEVFARGTGEFQNLTYEEVRQKLRNGKKTFSDVGLDDVVGFVAPSWLTNKNVEKALKDEGFKYHIFTTFMDYVGQLSMIPIKNLQTGEIIKSREFAFDASNAFIDYGTRGLAWLLTANQGTPTLRIAVHPSNIHNARLFDYILRLIKEVKKGRNIITYRELLGV